MSKDLAELISRAKAATGPNRELDADLDLALRGGEIQWRQANYTMDMYPVARRPSDNHVGGYEHEQVPQYTDSIDAALALVERVLPLAFVTLEKFSVSDEGANEWRAWVKVLNEDDLSSDGPSVRQSKGFGKVSCPPLAIILALLTALQSQGAS